MSQFSNDLANGTLCRQISIILVKVDVTNRVQLQVKVLGNSRDWEKVKKIWARVVVLWEPVQSGWLLSQVKMR